jgi:alginate O-acetyltransferase complex protein AlgI
VLAVHDKKRRYTDILLLITFLLIALWHGFSKAMVVWGLLNGLWIVIEKKFDFEKWKYTAFRKIGGVIYHLSIASLLALIFISPQPELLYKKMIVQPSHLQAYFLQEHLSSILIIVGCLGMMDYHYARAKDTPIDEYLGKKPQYIRWLIYLKLAMIILIFGTKAGVENYYIQF